MSNPFETLRNQFDLYLDTQTNKLPESRLKDAMRYSLLAGGKRVRPMLLFAALDAYGLPAEEGFPMAAAIEMIHTYSLIHDDMPEMDNDDLRRGRATCHRVYGDDIALLAGDGLQAFAFEQLKDVSDPKKAIDLCVLLARMAGPAGMCYGQDLDLDADGASSLEDIERIETYKTGCLIALPLCSAAILAGHPEDVDKWQQIGHQIGIQFQIQDDLLEKTSNAAIMGKSLSDERNEKATALTFFGLEEGKAKVLEYEKSILTKLDEFDLNDDLLRSLIEQLTHRTH
ncbi:farnesyl diphosphate synthase [Allobaculum sp. JKK-2023]|uniref:polyprenyl synthetase family protein n=1 Tax=Allobaculum sp. JKK-2023 TaxID=3108943 RepID=UPI002B05446E|nr:farnesyl diphosphate synthase [Allobaculum sp. JKK-2023]